jgi:chorismate mutase
MAPDPTTAAAAGEATAETLESYRASIDNIDAAIIHMLAERFKITRRVGEYKRVHQLPPADPTREAEQVARLRVLAQQADLDPEFGEAVIRFIISEVIRHHEKARS